jgi:1-acyl-sn-glycerol-3-phosphate acyltransferase
MVDTVVVAPRDSITAAIVARLAETGSSRTVDAPGAPYGGLPLADDSVLVYRPPLAGPPGGGPDLADAAAFFAALRGGGRRLVLLSSAAVHAPSHHHPGHVAETVHSTAANAVARAWADLEALAAALPHEVTVLRPATVLAPDSPDPLARLLAGRLAVVPAGYDPTVQLLAPADLAEAVSLAVEKSRGGVYHLAPAGAIPLRAALRHAGVRRLPLPHPLLGDADRLAYFRHPWTVSGASAARDLGFHPRHSSAAALREGDGAGFDDYGMDRAYIGRYARTLFRFLHDVYWRIEFRGLEHVPRQGAAVLTGVHRGFMPWDGVMLLHLLGRELGRYPRFLIHPCLVKPPFLANYMTKLGGILACQENADWVLGRGELLGMFPEGIHGAFTMYRDAYRLGKFGRDEYVKMALRNRAPIVPFVTVGSAEIYPILGRLDWKWVKRATEWLFLPLCPNFPFPGLPLPSKWHTLFLPAIDVAGRHPPEAADDPAVVRAISGEVRQRMQQAIDELLARRRSIFHGSVFTLPHEELIR